MGVREGRDERDRRAGHLALLRLALPDGTRRSAGPDKPPDDHGIVRRSGANRGHHPAAHSWRWRGWSLLRRRQKNYSGKLWRIKNCEKTIDWTIKCDQIERFLKVLGAKKLTKVAQMILKNHTLMYSSAASTLSATFGKKLGYFLLQHMVRSKLSDICVDRILLS